MISSFCFSPIIPAASARHRLQWDIWGRYEPAALRRSLLLSVRQRSNIRKWRTGHMIHGNGIEDVRLHVRHLPGNLHNMIIINAGNDHGIDLDGDAFCLEASDSLLLLFKMIWAASAPR
jgi:hypothetical protein